MKKTITTSDVYLNPPQVIVSVRDKEGRNNALVVGFCGNVSHDPYMVMVGIEPGRHSYHMVKENPCFVVNLPLKSFRKEFALLGTKSGRDMDKFEAAGIKWENGTVVDASILTDCPVNLECAVVDSVFPPGGSNELFIGRVDAIHVDEQYLNEHDKVMWKELDLIKWR